MLSIGTPLSMTDSADPPRCGARMADAKLPPLTLVLGGTRSGKSAFAERLVERSSEPVYLATGQPLDEEMAERVRQHKARRGAHWKTLEEPLDIARALRDNAGPKRGLLVDCLTLWLSNLMHAERDLDAELKHLLESLAGLDGPVVFVSNEVGSGVVPENALARRYVDQLGCIHQAIADRAERVYLVVAGIATTLKETKG